MRSEKKAEASVGEQHAASSGSLATYKPENDMSQGMQFLARLLMNVGAGMNTGSFNPGKGAGMGSQPQAKTLALQDAPPLPVDDAKREQCTGPVCKYICTVAFCTSSACDCEKIGLFVSDFFGEKAMAGVADPEEFTWSRVYGVVDTRPKWQEDRIVGSPIVWGLHRDHMGVWEKLTLLG